MDTVKIGKFLSH